MKSLFKTLRSKFFEDLLIISFFLTSTYIIFTSIDATANFNRGLTLSSYVAEIQNFPTENQDLV